MEKIVPGWVSKGYGIQVGEPHDKNARLHYLSFADDTTLFAKSRSALQKMITDVKRELGLVGLRLNADKCKVQCSVDGPRSVKCISVEGEDIPIVPSAEGFSLLGTMYSLSGGTKGEVKTRIKIAWGKFHQIWPLLKHRDSSLHQRLRLFNAVVGRSLLWGSESWTLTVAEKQQLRGVERSMLRRFAGPRRGPGEDWLVWIKRATKLAVDAAEQAGVQSWVHQHLCAKWNWAGHVARMESYREDSWAFRTTFWRGSAWRAENKPGSALHSLRPLRPRPGRWLRWEDEIAHYVENCGQGNWREAARDKSISISMAADFSNWRWK